MMNYLKLANLNLYGNVYYQIFFHCPMMCITIMHYPIDLSQVSVIWSSVSELLDYNITISFNNII